MRTTKKSILRRERERKEEKPCISKSRTGTHPSKVQGKMRARVDTT
jgi:hypothetical protein